MQQRRSVGAITMLTVFALAVPACRDDDDAQPIESAAPTTMPTSGRGSAPATSDALDVELPVLGDVVVPPWEPATRSEELAMELAESGAPTVQQAVDALGLIVDDVPGVTPSDLPAGDGLGTTYTLMLAMHLRDEMSPQQQARLDDVLAGGIEVGTVDRGGTMHTTGATENGWRRPAEPIPELELHYLELLAEVRLLWRARLPSHPEHASWKLEMATKPLPGGSGMDAVEIGGVCRIRVSPTFRATNPSDNLIRWVFAHELFHCMQDLWDPAWTSPPWLVQGSADFAAADLFRSTFHVDQPIPTWFSAPFLPLAARSYSAWPLFENLRIHAGDAYAGIEAMFKADHGSIEGMLAAGGMTGVLFRMRWSSRAMRSTSFDGAWRMAWPSTNPSFGPHDVVSPLGTRGIGIYHVKGAGKYTHEQVAVEIAPDVDIITVTPTGGPLTTYAAPGTITIGEQMSRNFCFTPDGCACPAGKESDAIPMNGRAMVFSFAAAAEAPSASVVAVEFDADQQCRDPEPDKASSNGDPHLVTFDGLPYDVMTLGEFVNARDPEGGFEVQTRHEPFVGGAGTTAVAIGTGDHRVTFTASGYFDLAPVVRLDGVETSASSFAAGDVAVTVEAGQATAVWPDGSAVRLRYHVGWFVTIEAPSERSARLVGLLGSADGFADNDLQFPDGTVVDPADASELESPFVRSWAVDDENSLFDYDPGESAATFRIPHPDVAAAAIDPAALEACLTRLGTSATSFEIESCAYDVSVTGEPEFVTVYEVVVEERVTGEPVDIVLPLPSGTEVVSTADVAAGVAGEPALTLSGDEGYVEGAISTEAGTVLIARAQTCLAELFVNVTVYDRDDPGVSATATVCDPQGLGGVLAGDGDEWIDGEAYVWLGAGGGEFDVSVDWFGSPGAFVAVDLFVDPAPTIVSPDELGDGDRSSLAGIADTVVYELPAGAMFTFPDGVEACVFEMYGALGSLGTTQPWKIDYCGHPERVGTASASDVLPVVVFNRTDDGLTVEAAPAP